VTGWDGRLLSLACVNAGFHLRHLRHLWMAFLRGKGICIHQRHQRHQRLALLR
jgi:hypothetical protein